MGKAPDAVLRLVENFDRHIQSYHSSAYNEAQLRQDFLNPFFEAMGWDVANRKGYDQRYREVVHEDAIKVGGTTKAPDYCFQIGGVRRFFVEAKAPFRDIARDPLPALQVRRYAWTAKLPLSLLSDFEELSVYDTRLRPGERDKSGTARLRLLTHHDYETAWEELVDTFSPDAILRGSFEKYAEKGGKRGTTQVDDEFLKDIERWRDLLARNIALRNPRLGDRDLNAAVQRTIDRVIFLRICEDRGIEPAGSLQSLTTGPRIYPRLFELFQRADDRYNSGLFHFRDERGREEPDTIAARLQIDDAALKTVISQLYYPSPYEFSVFPADILGQVYEQFLGKVIRLTEGHHAKVEEKPEVRKAGGVYYTPTYIVDYIVKNTVGKLLEGKTPKTAARLRILDPACGSGSFLLGAYQYLLDWHGDWYAKDGPDKHRKELYKGPGGEWRLTTQEKKRILLDNIYGVDIDAQAVEVTKLSLLLKVLEGESEQTIDRQMKMYAERALPDLSNNIKCGNSLIGSDFWQGQQQGLFDDEAERLRINAFDWDHEFKDIMAAGGFDAVIGNPPWLMAGYYTKDTLGHLKASYTSAVGKFDLYYLFMELGPRLLNSDGLFSMIVPNKFLHTQAATTLRGSLAQSRWLREIVDFADEQVFSGATNYSCIVQLAKRPSSKVKYARAHVGLAVEQAVSHPWTDYSSAVWHFGREATGDINARIEAEGVPLAELVMRFGTGVQTGADRVLTIAGTDVRSSGLESALLRPLLRGRDVRRYTVSHKSKLVVFPYKESQGEFSILSEAELRRFPRVHQLLNEHRDRLSERVWFGRSASELAGKWYGMMYLDRLEAFRAVHLLTPSLSNRANFALGTGWLFATGTAGVTSIIPRRDTDEDIKYLLGLLNSHLLSWYAVEHSPIFSGGYHKFSAPYLKRLPIRRIDFAKKTDKARHDKMVELVERMLDLNKKLPKATGAAKTTIERQIAATDKSIDSLVYELYGLSDKEIAIVEGST